MRANELIILLFERFCWLDEGIQRHFLANGWPEVSRSQSMIMINIITGTRRPSDIARRLGISRQAIHTTIGQMVDKGIVVLETDPEDGRHKLLDLTEFGARMRKDAQAAMGEMTDGIAARIGEKRFEELLDSLSADWGRNGA